MDLKRLLATERELLAARGRSSGLGEIDAAKLREHLALVKAATAALELERASLDAEIQRAREVRLFRHFYSITSF